MCWSYFNVILNFFQLIRYIWWTFWLSRSFIMPATLHFLLETWIRFGFTSIQWDLNCCWYDLLVIYHLRFAAVMPSDKCATSSLTITSIWLFLITKKKFPYSYIFLLKLLFFQWVTITRNYNETIFPYRSVRSMTSVDHLRWGLCVLGGR